MGGLLALPITLAALGATALPPAPSVRASASPAHGSVRGDFNGDGYADLAIGIPNGEGGIGAVEVMYGSPSGLTTAGSQHWTLDTPGVAGPRGAVGDLFGESVATGDFNGDRFADLAIGAPGARGVVVLYGSRQGLQAAGSQFLAGSASSGFSLAAGDFNADGYDDLAVGQPFAAATKPGAGTVEIHDGSATGLTAVARGTAQRLSEAMPGMPGPAPSVNDNFGIALVSGHFRGEKAADLAIGVPFSQGDGAAIVLYGSASGLTTAGSQYLESFAIAGEGGSALAAGDLNGDRIDDLVVGDPSATVAVGGAGAIEIHYGSTTGLRRVAQGTAQAFAEISLGMPGPPTAELDKFGWSLSIGDFNGDGIADVAVGVAGKSAVIALYGTPHGVTTRHSQYLAGVGPPVSSSLGAEAIATAVGDYNGDGYSDLVLGEPLATAAQAADGVVEAHAGSIAGLVDVPLGTGPRYSESTPGMAGPGPAAQDNFGFSLATAGVDR